MAKVQLSPLLSDLRKKAGGVVFQKGRQGIITRRKVAPTQPRSGAQKSVRSGFSTNSKAWPGSGMDATRAAWESSAAGVTLHDRFGSAFKPTGLQFFQRINRNLQTIAIAPITTPPADQTVASPGTVTLTATTGTPNVLSVAWTGTAGANDVPVVYAAAPQSAGRSTAGKKFTYLTKTTAAAASPFSLVTAYEAKYGALALRQKIFVQVAFVGNANGASSGRITASASVAAP